MILTREDFKGNLTGEAIRIRAKQDTPEQNFIREARKIIWMLIPESEMADEHTLEAIRLANQWLTQYYKIMKDRI